MYLPGVGGLTLNCNPKRVVFGWSVPAAAPKGTSRKDACVCVFVCAFGNKTRCTK